MEPNKSPTVSVNEAKTVFIFLYNIYLVLGHLPHSIDSTDTPILKSSIRMHVLYFYYVRRDINVITLKIKDTPEQHRKTQNVTSHITSRSVTFMKIMYKT